jgi:acyl-CoA thioester hydrolase
MKGDKTQKTLTERTEVDIHFYDIDSVKIVWHGNYLKYLENGREAFGKNTESAMWIYTTKDLLPLLSMYT